MHIFNSDSRVAVPSVAEYFEFKHKLKFLNSMVSVSVRIAERLEPPSLAHFAVGEWVTVKPKQIKISSIKSTFNSAQMENCQSKIPLAILTI